MKTPHYCNVIYASMRKEHPDIPTMYVTKACGQRDGEYSVEAKDRSILLEQVQACCKWCAKIKGMWAWMGTKCHK